MAAENLHAFNLFTEITGLTVSLGKFRFVIKKVKMAGRACHEKMDYTLGFGGMMKFSTLP